MVKFCVCKLVAPGDVFDTRIGVGEEQIVGSKFMDLKMQGQNVYWQNGVAIIESPIPCHSFRTASNPTEKTTPNDRFVKNVMASLRITNFGTGKTRWTIKNLLESQIWRGMLSWGKPPTKADGVGDCAFWWAF